MSTQITTGKVRFSYCNLFTPRAVQEGATPKYSVTLLIPKSDKATMQKIKAAMDEAKQKFMASNSGKKLPTNLKSTLHDGDGERGGAARRPGGGHRFDRRGAQTDARPDHAADGHGRALCIPSL